jgi:hypothetical protein
MSLFDYFTKTKEERRLAREFPEVCPIHLTVGSSQGNSGKHFYCFGCHQDAVRRIELREECKEQLRKRLDTIHSVDRHNLIETLKRQRQVQACVRVDPTL